MTGIPTVQAPSISAALSTSNATAATQQTATPTQSANAQPSVIIVEVLGYGGGTDQNQNDDEQRRHRDRRSSGYDTNNQIRVLGNGGFSEDDTKQLTASERETLATRFAAPGPR